MPTPSLLTYAINTTPKVFTVGQAGAALAVLATNLTHAPVAIQEIKINILAGSADADLTNEPVNIVPAAPNGWSVSKGNASGGYEFVFVPPITASMYSLPPGSSLSFALNNIALNAAPSTTTITVTESSTATPVTLPVSIWPDGWGDISFSASPADLTATGKKNVTLEWDGPIGATYQIQYINQATQQIVNIPAIGELPFSNSGVYPSTQQPALLVPATTVFTLSVTETISGVNYHRQLQAIVSVAETLSIISFTGQVVYNNGIPALELNWQTNDATYVTISGSDVQLTTNTSAPYSISPPFTSSYSITAYGVNGQSVKSAIIQLGWHICQTVNVSTRSIGIAVTPNSTYALMVSGYSGTLQVMTLNNFTVIDTITNGIMGPGAVATLPNNTPSALFLNGDNTVCVLSLNNFAITQTIVVGANPSMIAVTHDGSYAMTPNNSSNNVSIISLSNYTVTNTVAVGSVPYAAAFSPNGAYAFVTNLMDNTLSVILMSNFTVVSTVAVNGRPFAVAVTNDSNYALVVNNNTSIVTVIRTSDFTVIKTINVGNWPQNIAMTPDGNFALVANTGDNTLSVIRISDFTICQTVKVGVAPNAMAVTSDCSYALTVDFLGGTVTVLSLTVL